MTMTTQTAVGVGVAAGIAMVGLIAYLICAALDRRDDRREVTAAARRLGIDTAQDGWEALTRAVMHEVHLREVRRRKALVERLADEAQERWNR